jgi:hypothetical protein
LEERARIRTNERDEIDGIIRRMPDLSTQPFPIKSSNRPFRVFLSSGSSQRLTVARPMIDRLIACGFSVCDWTRFPDWDLGREPTEAELVEAAAKCEDCVRRCDLFWYLVPEEKSEGAASELALARALDKRIVASGEFGARNIFALLIPPEMRFPSHETAFLAVCNIAKDFRSFRGEF